MSVCANGDLPLLLCFSHLRWDFVFQRPQHLLSRAAKNHRVVFFEEPIRTHDVASPHLESRITAEGVTVVRPWLPHGLTEAETDDVQRSLLDRLLRDLGGPSSIAVSWYYTPMALAFSSHLRAGVTVYDCMDELSNFRGASPRLVLLERRLLRTADLVFTGGRSLFEGKRDLHPQTHLFPSAVDAGHFGHARDLARLSAPEPEDQAGLSRPRIGWFGVIDERMDLDLVDTIAARRPDWSMVMLGPVAKIDPAQLPQRPNIHWLGMKSHNDLPCYLAGWDVGLMPFALNDATRFISPTKTPEYLAAGVPVVSTAVPDVVRDWGHDGSVAIASDALSAIVALEAAMSRPREAWLTEVDARLSGISWDSTWQHMLALISEAATRAVGSPLSSSLGTKASRASDDFDWLVVGAGFAGAVLAERLAKVRGEQVLVIDKRDHVAGNAFDERDAAGLVIHRYGPHIFHTNSEAVFTHLSRFTSWRAYQHRVLAHLTDGPLVPMPINRTTVNRLYGMSLTTETEVEAFFASRAEEVPVVRTSEDVVVSRVGRQLYETFFRGYTRKQWGLDPSELDKSVTSRVPTRADDDDRYFTDTHQFMPADGYTAMFQRILDHPNITVMTGTDYAEMRDRVSYRRMIWTGPIDEFFEYRYGKLPYRSLRFRHETHNREWFQPVGTVNYPGEEVPWTRVSEYKHLTGQQHPSTSITYEYPASEGDPYYPVPRPENAALYKRYEALADATPDVWFVGRLATYRYYNMDQVVAQSLATFRRIEAEVPRRPEDEAQRVAAGD